MWRMIYDPFPTMTIKGINSSYKPSSLQGMENNPQKINDFPSEKKRVFDGCTRAGEFTRASASHLVSTWVAFYEIVTIEKVIVHTNSGCCERAEKYLLSFKILGNIFGVYTTGSDFLVFVLLYTMPVVDIYTFLASPLVYWALIKHRHCKME